MKQYLILNIILPAEKGSSDDDGYEIDIEIPPGNGFFFFLSMDEYAILFRQNIKFDWTLHKSKVKKMLVT